MTDNLICRRCFGFRWVCEAHSDMAWEGEYACGCGAPGMPRPDCNVSDALQDKGGEEKLHSLAARRIAIFGRSGDGTSAPLVRVAGSCSDTSIACS